MQSARGENVLLPATILLWLEAVPQPAQLAGHLSRQSTAGDRDLVAAEPLFIICDAGVLHERCHFEGPYNSVHTTACLAPAR